MDKSCVMAEMDFTSSVDEARAREVAELVVRSRNLSPHFVRVAHTYAARWLYLQTRFAGMRRPTTEASLGRKLLVILLIRRLKDALDAARL